MVPCYYFFFTAAALIEWWKKGSDRPCVGKYLHLYFEALRLFFLDLSSAQGIVTFCLLSHKNCSLSPFPFSYIPLYVMRSFFLPSFIQSFLSFIKIYQLNKPKRVQQDFIQPLQLFSPEQLSNGAGTPS